MLHTNQPTNKLRNYLHLIQSFSAEVGSSAASQGIPHIVRNQVVCFLIRNIRPLLNPRQMNSVHAIPS